MTFRQAIKALLRGKIKKVKSSAAHSYKQDLKSFQIWCSKKETGRANYQHFKKANDWEEDK